MRVGSIVIALFFAVLNRPGLGQEFQDCNAGYQDWTEVERSSAWQPVHIVRSNPAFDTTQTYLVQLTNAGEVLQKEVGKTPITRWESCYQFTNDPLSLPVKYGATYDGKGFCTSTGWDRLGRYNHLGTGLTKLTQVDWSVPKRIALTTYVAPEVFDGMHSAYSYDCLTASETVPTREPALACAYSIGQLDKAIEGATQQLVQNVNIGAKLRFQLRITAAKSLVLPSALEFEACLVEQK